MSEAASTKGKDKVAKGLAEKKLIRPLSEVTKMEVSQGIQGTLSTGDKPFIFPRPKPTTVLSTTKPTFTKVV